MTSILVKKKEYSKPPNCHVYHIHLKKKRKISDTILVEDENCYSVTKLYQLLIFHYQHLTVQTCTVERGGRDDSDPLELRQR